MAGLAFDLNVREAVEATRAAFEEFSAKAFPRAVQFALNKVVIDAVNRFRDDELPAGLRHYVPFTRQGVRYELDRSRLDTVTSVDQVVSAAFILPLQSTWLKYALGETLRKPGDYGLEGFFPDQSQLYLPHEAGLAEVGIRPNAQGNYRGADIKRIGRMMAEGYRTSGGARFAGVFEIKAGDRDPAGLGVGLHSRPLRGTAVASRSRIRDKVRRGAADAPRTQFTAARGRQVDVPRVVNQGVPQLLFLTRPDATYRPVLTPGWERAMEKAASRIGDILEAELADKFEHAVRRGRR